MCVWVSVRYRTYLNVVGIGSQLLGVLRRTLRWSSTRQMFKKLFFLNGFIDEKPTRNGKMDGNKKQERGREREMCSTRATLGTPYSSNYIEGKFCVSACVSVRYRT
jgi:hypothetical protein